MPVFVIFDYRGTMANLKNCVLKISSNVINLDDGGKPDGAPEKDELLVDAALKTDSDVTRISYKEARDGSSVFCEIEIKKSAVTVRRRGDVSCDMLFSVGKAYKSLYSVPPFSFDMEINTLRIENEFDKDGGSLTLLYEMTVGGAKKRCRMKIQKKN